MLAACRQLASGCAPSANTLLTREEIFLAAEARHDEAARGAKWTALVVAIGDVQPPSGAVAIPLLR